MRRHMSLGLDDLRTIVALAEELNFHRAARKVGLTQSAVTRIVARVERHAGTTLFERSHSKRQSVALTDAGRRYVEKARLAIAHTDGAVLAARETLHGIDHRIGIGKSMYTDRRLITILRTMELPLYPKLQVTLETRLPGELPACVRSGEIDLAVVSNPLDDTFLTGTVVRCTPFTVTLPAWHKCANRQTVTLEDLSSTPWVLFERQIHPALYDTFLRRAQNLGIGVDRIHHIADAEEACEVVRLIGGAAFLSPQGAARAATDEVILLPLEEKDIFLKTQLVARTENASMLVSEFVRTFVKRLKHAGLYQPALEASTNVASCAA
ncbi:MAG: LysR family transcriptional regulator [Terracidiphilus sp.]